MVWAVAFLFGAPLVARAEVLNLTGAIPLRTNYCGISLLNTEQINQTLTCVYGTCKVQDHVEHISMSGVYPTNEALLEGVFKDITNKKCEWQVAYAYTNINTKAKSLHLKEYYVNWCKNAPKCDYTYEGSVKIK